MREKEEWQRYCNDSLTASNQMGWERVEPCPHRHRLMSKEITRARLQAGVGSCYYVRLSIERNAKIREILILRDTI